MKRYLLLCVLLLAVVLCSCTDVQPGGEAVSIVFMEESIVAPTSYPNVPDEYAPVLADLYLYGELLHRYETVTHEGEVTQEIQDECEAVQDTIRERGYVLYPNGGIEGTSGYALVDLDGDKYPELLLLNRSSDVQTPTICSVFTVRDGQLVHLEEDSYELQHATILSADGTFYRYLDWQGSGYVNISAFRLEEDMTELTIVSEARSALAFNDGEVPEAYWVKVEDGQEAEITEEEFYALLGEYRQPEEWMKLDFVPLHPDRMDSYPISRPDGGVSTIPIEYPLSYQGAPSGYRSILDNLYLLSEHMHGEEPLDSILEEVGFAEYPRDGKLAYAVVDINDDNVPELLLGTVDGLRNAAPHSIFTIKDGKPVLLGSFWSRNSGVISADGIIYRIGSGGASYTYLSSYKLDKKADTLTQLTDIHSDYSDSEGKPYFVQVVDGRNRYITEEVFWDLYEQYDNLPETIDLTIMPIAD